MPQHKSAAKRVRQSAERRERNRVQRSRMRTMMKQLREMDNKKEAQEYLNRAKATLDQLASKGIIHKNKAANYKSELEIHVNRLG